MEFIVLFVGITVWAGVLYAFVNKHSKNEGACFLGLLLFVSLTVLMASFANETYEDRLEETKTIEYIRRINDRLYSIEKEIK